MSLKFSTNLSFMFFEGSNILDRYQLASDAGFKAVESGFPLGFSIQQVVEAKNKAGVQQILINVYTGDVTKGELGFAAIPGKEKDFEKSIKLTIDYAKALGCKMIHIMSGRVENPIDINRRVYERNLSYAIELFENENILGLIEPINEFTVPNYYLNSYDLGLELIEKINSPNLKLLLDLFHLQQISGNVTRNIEKLLPHIGHVQVAQVPHRNEPDSPGELNYPYIFSLMEEKGYNGYVGLEYKPNGNSFQGLEWIKKFGYELS